MHIRKASLILVLVLALCSNAVAEYKKVGNGLLDSVRSANISASCSYRLKSATINGKTTSYALGYVREIISSSPSYVLEGGISYTQLLELNGITPSVYVSSRPSPGTSPTADTADQLRVEIYATTAPVVKVSMRGQQFVIKSTFFDLEKECGSFDALAIEGMTPSASCPGLTVRSANNIPCSCPYRFNEMTSGMDTPCGYLPSGNSGPGNSTVMMCMDGSTGSSQGCTNNTSFAKTLGPVGPGLSSSYVFDYRSCGCKLCDFWYYKRSDDLRSCQCRYQTADDVVNFRNQAMNQNNLPYQQPAPFFADGDPCTTLTYNSSGGRTQHQLKLNVIFDPQRCACIACPPGKMPNEAKSACQ